MTMTKTTTIQHQRAVPPLAAGTDNDARGCGPAAGGDR
jgi:hypothetical protein